MKRLAVSRASTLPILMSALALAGVAGCSDGGTTPPDDPTTGVMPPPISGGTLAVTAEGVAVAADPDRDRVWIVNLESQAIREIALLDGDEPGRVATGDSKAFVALRRGGAVVKIDVTSGAIESRTPVCPAPRGIAYDSDKHVVHVACAGGELVTISSDSGALVRSLRFERDLRDVVVSGDGLILSRFRSTELLSIKADGSIANTVTPAPFEQAGFEEGFDGAESKQVFEPAVAWRTVAVPGGGVAMVHQRAVEEPVLIAPGGYGNGGCGTGIVDSTVSIVRPTADPKTPLAQPIAATSLPAAILPVDIAVSDSGAVAVIAAGNDKVMTSYVGNIESDFPDPCGSSYLTEVIDGQPIAVAFSPSGEVIVQTREPARVFVLHGVSVDLPGASMASTGHDMFHRNSNGMSALACASCHPEGGDDGRVWAFNPIGERRTQNLRGGIMQTAPFHWDGDMHDLGAIMDEVFVNRMGGVTQGPKRVKAFGEWLDTIPALPDAEPSDVDAVKRGEAIFNDPSVACATCHSGALYTNNATMDVGTGREGVDQAFQVPSLIGVRWRAPFLHDGAAKTMRDRFGMSGGGDKHGHTSQLSDAQIGDLVLFLDTL